MTRWEKRKKILVANGWEFIREGQEWPFWGSPQAGSHFSDELREMSDEEFDDTIEINKEVQS